MAEIPINLGFYESSSLPLAAQGCINWYPHTPQTIGASSGGGLFYTPGLQMFKPIRGGANRTLIFFNAEIFSVNGNDMYKYPSAGLPVSLGAISGDGQVSIASNGLVLAIIVPGGDGYFYDESSGGLSLITDPVFQDFQAQSGGVTSVTTKGTTFVYTTSLEYFVGSPITQNNGKNFDALDFGAAEINPDPNVRVFTLKDELYIAGTRTIEIFQEIGGSGLPFEKIQGASIEKGLAARFGMAFFDNTFIFLGGAEGDGLAIWRAASGQAIKLSTSAIEHAIDQYTVAEIQAVTAWSYGEEGSSFAGFNFPDKTFVYDALESSLQARPVWHIRESNGSRFRVENIISALGKTIVGDALDGRLGVMDRAITSEYDTDVEREFSGAFLSNGGEGLTVTELRLKTQNGVGTGLATSDENPVINMFISDDGGYNYINCGPKLLGKQGQYFVEQNWRGLGYTPESRVFKFTTKGQFKSNVLRMDLDMEGLI